MAEDSGGSKHPYPAAEPRLRDQRLVGPAQCISCSPPINSRLRETILSARDYALSPAATDPEIAARSMAPVSTDPDGAVARRVIPSSANPYISPAVPEPVAADPDVIRTGLGGNDLDLRRGWRRFDDHRIGRRGFFNNGRLISRRRWRGRLFDDLLAARRTLVHAAAYPSQQRQTGNRTHQNRSRFPFVHRTSK